jgi:hypothetical protein
MMNDAIEAELGLPTFSGTTFSVEVDLVIVEGSFSGDVATGVVDGGPAVAVRDKNSGIGGAMPLPQGFHQEAGSMVPA